VVESNLSAKTISVLVSELITALEKTVDTGILKILEYYNTQGHFGSVFSHIQKTKTWNLGHKTLWVLSYLYHYDICSKCGKVLNCTHEKLLL